MRNFFAYLLYFVGFAISLANLMQITYTLDNGKEMFRSLDIASSIMFISIFVYFVFRDAASIVKGESFLKSKGKVDSRESAFFEKELDSGKC